MEPRIIKVTITVDGIERNYAGDYYELHSTEWDEKVRDMLDTVHFAHEEENIDHAKDQQI